MIDFKELWGAPDWIVLVLYFIGVMSVGFIMHRKASKNFKSFFVASRRLTIPVLIGVAAAGWRTGKHSWYFHCTVLRNPQRNSETASGPVDRTDYQRQDSGLCCNAAGPDSVFLQQNCRRFGQYCSDGVDSLLLRSVVRGWRSVESGIWCSHLADNDYFWICN